MEANEETSLVQEISKLEVVEETCVEGAPTLDVVLMEFFAVFSEFYQKKIEDFSFQGGKFMFGEQVLVALEQCFHLVQENGSMSCVSLPYDQIIQLLPKLDETPRQEEAETPRMEQVE